MQIPFHIRVWSHMQKYYLGHVALCYVQACYTIEYCSVISSKVGQQGQFHLQIFIFTLLHRASSLTLCMTGYKIMFTDCHVIQQLNSTVLSCQLSLAVLKHMVKILCEDLYMYEALWYSSSIYIHQMLCHIVQTFYNLKRKQYSQQCSATEYTHKGPLKKLCSMNNNDTIYVSCNFHSYVAKPENFQLVDQNKSSSSKHERGECCVFSMLYM